MAEEPTQQGFEDPGADLLPPGCGMWLGWIVTSIAGTGLGWALGWQASFLLPGSLSIFGLGAVLGVISGGLNSLVLRGHLGGSFWWTAATTAGWTAGFPLGVFFAQQLGLTEILFGLVVGMVVGGLLGGLQWLVLRRQVSAAFVWVPASSFAWAASLIYYRPGVSGIGLLFGALYGIVGGIVLLWLIHRPEPEPVQNTTSGGADE